MKTVVSFLVAFVVCGVFYYIVDVGFMKTQGLPLFPEKTETKSSH